MSEKPPLKLAAAPAQPQPPSPVTRIVTQDELVARTKPRHRLLFWSFIFLVFIPTVAAALYLYIRAADQYHSIAAFSVRSEEYSSPLDALSAITDVASSSTSDSTILYDFIRSQPLVERVNNDLDLRALYSKPTEDPVFRLKDAATVEDIISHWEKMVAVSVESGVIYIDARAFTPEDAQAIAQSIVDQSTSLINELSQIAQEDAMRFALEDVAGAEARLKDIRKQVSEFRAENRIINPEADVESQMGVVSQLQSQLAEALIRKSSLLEYAEDDDQRVLTLERQIRAIRQQIENERAIVGQTDTGGPSLSQVIGQYEELLVDLEFSQNAYTAALAASEQARAEARRQSRYAAVHIPPTLAEQSLFPKRGLLTALFFICALSAWAIFSLIYYNVRDRS